MAITYPDTYLLANSSTELDRLYLQAKVWEPEAEVMLDHIAVQPGWKCVDLGCGGMSILQSLSRRVGIQGHIIGVDNDPRQLAAACDYVRDNQLENVDILEQDIYHTRLPREFFDLTHARCLFAAANHDEELLREMLSLTRSGGILAIQEPDVTSWKCYPTDPAWEQLNRIVLDAFKPGGSDFNVGQRIFKMLRHAGLEDVKIRTAVVALQDQHSYKQLPIQFVTSLRQRILEAGSISVSELDNAIAPANRLPAIQTQSSPVSSSPKSGDENRAAFGLVVISNRLISDRIMHWGRTAFTRTQNIHLSRFV